MSQPICNAAFPWRESDDQTSFCLLSDDRANQCQRQGRRRAEEKRIERGQGQPVRQELAVRDYASANDIEIVGEYYDAAVSGADMINTRPGFDVMLKAILGNGVRTILVESQPLRPRSHRARDGYQYLKSRGVDLIAVDSPGSFLDDTPTATFIDRFAPSHNPRSLRWSPAWQTEGNARVAPAASRHYDNAARVIDASASYVR